ncbi:arrestin domain-containing protein 2-like [Polistes fuscatus]|uniref:arrestin domain-containing protein 2-like n=1 Tax=Polistes fuscatus TaxID=30207 RepID=UPI001CA97EBB|nr:arrestin domain-containing protein 2-like [Polistes fuscatus]
MKQSLLRRSTEIDRIELPEGESTYYFSFQLPINIPCSFEHSTGYIRYTAKAIVDIPWRFNWWTKSAFTVVTPYDLNTFSDQCMGIDDEISKDFSCCCFKKGSLNVRIKVPNLGYVPGQFITTEVISNLKSSNIQIIGITTKLIEELIFHAHGSTERKQIVIQKNKSQGPIKNYHETQLNLYVPSLPPSNLEHCGIIELKYRLHVIIHFGGMQKKIDQKYPILIGTIPLNTSPLTEWTPTNDTQPTAPRIDEEPSTSTSIKPVPVHGHTESPERRTDSPGTSQPNFNKFQLPNQSVGWNMEPPSYEECTQRADNIKDSDDSNSVYGADQPFAPRYPVFNFMYYRST